MSKSSPGHQTITKPVQQLDLIRHGDKLGGPNFRSSQGKDQFERKKERKKEMKVERKKKNQKRNTHLFFSSINSVHVSRNYGNKLMNFFGSIFVLHVDAQYALNTRAARV